MDNILGKDGKAMWCSSDNSRKKKHGTNSKKQMKESLCTSHKKEDSKT
jgi:hypothetical protein